MCGRGKFGASEKPAYCPVQGLMAILIIQDDTGTLCDFDLVTQMEIKLETKAQKQSRDKIPSEHLGPDSGQEWLLLRPALSTVVTWRRSVHCISVADEDGVGLRDGSTCPSPRGPGGRGLRPSASVTSGAVRQGPLLPPEKAAASDRRDQVPGSTWLAANKAAALRAPHAPARGLGLGHAQDLPARLSSPSPLCSQGYLKTVAQTGIRSLFWHQKKFGIHELFETSLYVPPDLCKITGSLSWLHPPGAQVERGLEVQVNQD